MELEIRCAEKQGKMAQNEEWIRDARIISSGRGALGGRPHCSHPSWRRANPQEGISQNAARWRRDPVPLSATLFSNGAPISGGPEKVEAFVLYNVQRAPLSIRNGLCAPFLLLPGVPQWDERDAAEGGFSADTLKLMVVGCRQ